MLCNLITIYLASIRLFIIDLSINRNTLFLHHLILTVVLTYERDAHKVIMTFSSLMFVELMLIKRIIMNVRII